MSRHPSFFFFTGQPQLEEELISEIAKLQSSLSKEQESCALLHHQVEHLLTKHSEEISARDDVISQLNTELDAKASVIALVTQQLCQVRAKLKQEVETRSKKPIACVCPHCFVHRKSSTEGKLSPLQEYSSNTGNRMELPNATLVPSPPSATPPHPPPPMASRHRIIKRRASTPIRRQSPSPRNSLINLSLDSSKDITLRPPRANKDPSILSSDFQEFLSLKDGVAKPVRRERHPVLPPIPSPLQDEKAAGNLVIHSHTSYPGNQQISGASNASSSNARHRLILAKSKGLSSAPSTLRVLHYGARSKQDSGGGGGTSGAKEEEEAQEEDLAAAPEGALLLVKKNDPGSMGPPQCAAPWTE